jgi:dTDP-glucose pyrophosphorylase
MTSWQSQCQAAPMSLMRSDSFEVVGLVPAAGKGQRLPRLPCSKELYPIGFRADQKQGSLQTQVVSQQLLDKFSYAGVTRAYIVLRDGKWDIPAYFREGEMVGLALAYVVISESLGPPDTLDRAYPFVKNDIVAFGFPDILFGPDDVFVRLLTKLKEVPADVVLGLYPAAASGELDMANVDSTGRVAELLLKPKSTDARFTWTCAVWRPRFTEFMHQFVQAECAKGDTGPLAYKGIDAQGDLPVGAVIKRAIEEDFPVHGVVFPDDSFLDVGTPRSLASATSAFRMQMQ